jgi:integrase
MLNTVKNYEFLLGKFEKTYSDREIESIATEEIISFLADMSEGRKQNTKRSRYTTLSAFFNLIINTLQPEMPNYCHSPAARNLFRKPKTYQWIIFDKDTIDEAIFRTLNNRNEIVLELMARGGIRISEVLGLKPADIDDQKLLLHDQGGGIQPVLKKRYSRHVNFG